MAKKVTFSKKQIDYINEEEQVNIMADPKNGDIKTAVNNAKVEASKAGLTPDKINVVIPGKQLEECISGKQLKQMRLQYLKEHSVCGTKKDLFK